MSNKRVIGPKPPLGPKRPRCPGCQKALIPVFNRVSEDGEGWGTPGVGFADLTWKIWTGYAGYQHFCTMRCATAFANRVIDRRLKETEHARNA